MSLNRAGLIVAFAAALLIPLAAGDHQVIIKNLCARRLHAFSLENGPGKPTIDLGDMGKGQQFTRSMPDNWEGRFWARFDDVQPFSGWPQPDSLAEIKFEGYMGLDFYDISLVDGFTVPIKIFPVMDTMENGAGKCKAIACTANILASCPEELKLRQGDKVVACQSSCTKFKRSDYCCTGPNQPRDKCPQNSYGLTFKRACGDAYSWAYDDASSTFTCKSAPGKKSSYVVQFCG